jgi:transcriptional regulator GlxA family with amidase domain
MRRSRKQVWFFVVPGSDLLDVCGPWEVFGHANDVLGRVAYELELRGPSTPLISTRHALAVAGVRPLPKTDDRRPHRNRRGGISRHSAP